jgi:hypothetical protein
MHPDPGGFVPRNILRFILTIRPSSALMTLKAVSFFVGH